MSGISRSNFTLIDNKYLVSPGRTCNKCLVSPGRTCNKCLVSPGRTCNKCLVSPGRTCNKCLVSPGRTWLWISVSYVNKLIINVWYLQVELDSEFLCPMWVEPIFNDHSVNNQGGYWTLKWQISDPCISSRLVFYWTIKLV